jgi:cytochrome b561
MNSSSYADSADIPELETAEGKAAALRELLNLRQTLRLRDSLAERAATQERIVARAVTFAVMVMMVVVFLAGLLLGTLSDLLSFDKENTDVPAESSPTK